MGNNNKRKIITGCVAGAILLLFATVLVACSKDNNSNVEVANITEDVSTDEIDEVMSGDTSVEQENTESVEKESDKDIAENETEQAETEEPNTEEPTEKTETSKAEDPAAENAETSNKEGTVNTESNNTEPVANKTVTTSSNWGTPQEYNGDPEGRGPDRIIVKGFNYNDFLDEVSWKGEYWTASNGIEIKVVSIIDGKGVGMIAVPDGKGKDIEFNSPYMVAVAEAEGINLNKYVADLNVTIPLSSYKKAEIDINDADLVAYRNAYDYKLYAINGETDLYKPYQYGAPVNQRLAVASDGIGEFDAVGAQFWRIRRVNDYWELRMNSVPEEFRWDGIHIRIVR